MELSFEFFPPKSNTAKENLLNTARALTQFKPSFFSMTYGAGGSVQSQTLNAALDVMHATKIPCAPHISCIGATKATLSPLLQLYKDQGINHLVVLRGDLPSGMMGLDPNFRHAYQLVEFIRAETSDHFFIDVAAYPEMHPETPNPKKHIEHLKMKIDAGANRAITQYFFNCDAYFALLEECAKHHIDVPIIPGIMPITNYAQLSRFSQLCGAEIPRWLRLRLEAAGDDIELIKQIGLETVGKLCTTLASANVPELHFYTLNKYNATAAIIENYLEHHKQQA